LFINSEQSVHSLHLSKKILACKIIKLTILTTEIPMKKLSAGDYITPVSLSLTEDISITIPHPKQLTHLQFRRFAGCPMCNLHIHSFIQRHDELVHKGVQEVAIFHSPPEKLYPYQNTTPFALVADPNKHLYRQFYVETSLSAILHPKVWLSGVIGLIRHGLHLPSKGESPLGLPADFLIASDGKILAAHYGIHAYDHWEIDELLSLIESVPHTKNESTPPTIMKIL
jgi:peroxiredoxin